jgi:catechol 2,3-dioxygenase-like lactoylglutathione lyase family enzyme
MTGARARLASVVMFVSDLSRSVLFYTELLGLRPTIENESVALLVGPDGSQLYLREIGDKATHALCSIGTQYVLWTAASEADLRACETILQTKSDRVTMTDEGGFELLEARDPDDVPVIITFPGPDEVARERIISRIYEW